MAIYEFNKERMVKLDETSFAPEKGDSDET